MSAKLTGKDLVDLLRSIPGTKAIKYSGRNMFGKTCVAAEIETSNEYSFGAELCAGHDGPATQIVDLMDEVKTDDMGKYHMVFYWPDIAWPDGVGDDSDPTRDDGDE